MISIPPSHWNRAWRCSPRRGAPARVAKIEDTVLGIIDDMLSQRRSPSTTRSSEGQGGDLALTRDVVPGVERYNILLNKCSHANMLKKGIKVWL